MIQNSASPLIVANEVQNNLCYLIVLPILHVPAKTGMPTLSLFNKHGSMRHYFGKQRFFNWIIDISRKLLFPDLNHGLITVVSDKLLESVQPDFSFFRPCISGIIKVQKFVIHAGNGNPVRLVFPA